MRKEAAFNIIPELVGDFVHVMELSSNTKLLYVETAINTLHAATEVCIALSEYNNSKSKTIIKQTIQQKYEEQKHTRVSNLQTEEIRRLDVEYEKIKDKLQDGRFNDVKVREFIKYLEKELQKVISIFQSTQIDPDYIEREKVLEMARKTLRDYSKLINIYIEEDGKDGQV